MEKKEWDEDMLWWLKKYVSFPICEKCYDKLWDHKQLNDGDYEFFSDDYYRRDWNMDYCFFCDLKESMRDKE